VNTIVTQMTFSLASLRLAVLALLLVSLLASVSEY
jgi:hypothetical protein